MVTTPISSNLHINYIASSLHDNKLIYTDTLKNPLIWNNEDLHALLLILFFLTSFLSCNMLAM